MHTFATASLAASIPAAAAGHLTSIVRSMALLQLPLTGTPSQPAHLLPPHLLLLLPLPSLPLPLLLLLLLLQAT
jgi:hypothetical protein